jgi:hypothetical protein
MGNMPKTNEATSLHIYLGYQAKQKKQQAGLVFAFLKVEQQANTHYGY